MPISGAPKLRVGGGAVGRWLVRRASHKLTLMLAGHDEPCARIRLAKVLDTRASATPLLPARPSISVLTLDALWFCRHAFPSPGGGLWVRRLAGFSYPGRRVCGDDGEIIDSLACQERLVRP